VNPIHHGHGAPVDLLELWQVLGLNAAVVAVVMLVVWIVSLAKGDVSIVDVVWGLGFVLLAWLTYVAQEPGAHGLVMCILVTLWGLRLAGHILVRNWGQPEDARYRKLRRKYAPFWWKSLFVVFALQGVLLLIVSLPLQLGERDGNVVLDVVGGVVFGCGFLIETIADLQLFVFKRAFPREVMDRGLWAWSRHPNYFGEMVLWWGLGLMAISADLPWSILALLGPATITFLLLRVSGVPMLEASMKERRPAYAAYIERVPSFWPKRPAPPPYVPPAPPAPPTPPTPA
jgi:steroid 5-alpha reductase family enzyme